MDCCKPFCHCGRFSELGPADDSSYLADLFSVLPTVISEREDPRVTRQRRELLKKMESFVREIENETWTTASWFEPLSSWLRDRYGNELPSSLDTIAAFVDVRCEEGFVQEVVDAVRILAQVFVDGLDFDPYIARVCAAIHHVGNVFEKAALFVSGISARTELISDWRGTVVDFWRQLLCSTPQPDASLKHDAQEMGIMASSELVVTHIKTTGDVPIVILKSVTEIIAAGLGEEKRDSVKGTALDCLIQFRSYVQESGGHEKCGEGSGNGFTRLCSSIASRIRQFPEKGQTEIGVLLSTGLKKGRQWSNGDHMLMLLYDVFITKKQSVTGRLAFVILPNLPPALHHESATIRIIFYAFLFPALNHVFSLPDHQKSVEFLRLYINRGLSDRNAYIRLKVLGDTMAFLVSVCSRRISKASAVTSIRHLLRATSAKIMDVSKLVRSKAMQSIKHFFEQCLGQGDASSTVFDGVTDLAAFLTRQLFSVLRAKPDSILHSESLKQQSLEILKLAVRIKPFQVEVTAAAVHFEDNSVTLTALQSILSEIDGRIIFHHGARAMKTAQTICRLYITRFVLQLPRNHRSLSRDGSSPSSCKSVAWSSIEFLTDLASHPLSIPEEELTDCRILLASEVIAESIDSVTPIADWMSLISLLYRVLDLTMDREGERDKQRLYIELGLLKSMQRILERLSFHRATASELEERSIEEAVLTYQHCLCRKLLGQQSKRHAFVIEEAIIAAVCTSEQGTALFLSIIDTWTPTNLDKSKQLRMYLFMIQQECHRLELSLETIHEQFNHVHLDSEAMQPMSKEEMDTCIATAKEDFREEYIATHALDCKAGEIRRQLSTESLTQFCCLKGLLCLSVVSESCREQLIEFLVQSLNSCDGFLVDFTLCCSMELYRSGIEITSEAKACLFDALSNFIVKGMQCREESSRVSNVTLLHAFVSLGFWCHTQGTAAVITSFPIPLLKAIGVALAGSDHKLCSVAERILTDQMATKSESMGRVLTAVIHAADPPVAIRLGEKLAEMLNRFTASRDVVRYEAEAVVELVQGYIDLKCETKSEAVLEIVQQMKPNRRILVTLTQHLETTGRTVPKEHREKLKRFLMKGPIAGAETKTGNEQINAFVHQQSTGRIQARLLSMLSSINSVTDDVGDRFAS